MGGSDLVNGGVRVLLVHRSESDSEGSQQPRLVSDTLSRLSPQPESPDSRDALSRRERHGSSSHRYRTYNSDVNRAVG